MKSIIFALCAALCAVVLLSSTSFLLISGQSTSFSAPINLSNTSYQANYPWVANVGNNVYVAWEEGSYGVWFRASSDGGSTWSSSIRLSSPGGVTQYPIVYAMETYVYVVWAQSVSQELQIFFTVSKNSGTSFSPAQQLTSGPSPNGFITPVIAASGSDVYIAYTGGGKNSYVIANDNYGAPGSWTAPFHYSDTHEPQIAAEGSNAYAIADGVGIGVTNNGGQTWSIAVNSTKRGDEPWVAASGQYVYVSSQTKTSDGNIHFFYSDNYGKAGSWTSEPGVDISGTISDTWQPQIAASGNYLFVGFHNPVSPKMTNYAVMSSNNGKTWSSPVAISGTAQTVSWVYQVTTSGCGGGYSCTGSAQYVFATWSEKMSSTNWQLFVSESSDYGSTWSSPINVSNNPTGAAAPNTDIAPASIAANGPAAFVVWQQNDTAGLWQVYFAAS